MKRTKQTPKASEEDRKRIEERKIEEKRREMEGKHFQQTGTEKRG